MTSLRFFNRRALIKTSWKR